jgi:DNA-directed RNA polymerase subunit RPC12/RpoP
VTVVNERVPFRLYQMPCCSYLYCSVSARMVTYCPECGTRVLLELRSGECTRVQDDNATLKYTMELK